MIEKTLSVTVTITERTQPLWSGLAHNHAKLTTQW
jgi:hypothetical protein